MLRSVPGFFLTCEGFDGPHLMLLVSDPRELRGLPTKRQNGAPFVMWRGTPYVHVMVPTSVGTK